MLKKTFIHLKGIGNKKEKAIWGDNFYGWDSIIEKNNTNLSIKSFKEISEKIEVSKKQLELRNAIFFYNLLPSREQWRLFGEFREESLFLDIETNGSNPETSIITTVATYDGKTIKHYVNDENLDEFVNDIYDYKVLITYNGKCFDVPFIERFFNIHIDHAQIDLRYILSSLGFKGGLKSCESQLGISRNELQGVDGSFAIHLWNEYYYNGNQKALDSLLAYNIQDAVNLEFLMYFAYNSNLEKLDFLNNRKFKIPKRPQIPFNPDMKTLNKIKSRMDLNRFMDF
tara:strand:- start:24 stop:878 length:855 start_codon:yes stop_codon:yes gene_type:complete